MPSKHYGTTSIPAAKRELTIHLLKRVPIQTGLGGGSADAAAMLVGLNRFWDLRLTQEELYKSVATLGSDVPFPIARWVQHVARGVVKY